MSETYLDIKRATAIPPAQDPANIAQQGRVVSVTERLMMFTTNKAAAWAAEEFLREKSYPFARLSLPCNRKAWKHEVGDVVRLVYPPYGITGMVVRILGITEEKIDSENIIITAMEDPYGITGERAIAADEVYNDLRQESAVATTVSPLTEVAVFEAPWAASGNDIAVIPLAARGAGNETGYYLYMSVDGGSSYSKIFTADRLYPHATLGAGYPADTMDIDDDTGFVVDFDLDAEASGIETISREGLFSEQNLALLGDEIITFQTITPVEGHASRYRIENVLRRQFDTEKETHAAGTEFWFIGTRWDILKNPNIMMGSTRHFKFVPVTLSATGELAEASATSVVIAGRARKPYPPTGLKANGVEANAAPTYTGDITLSWYPRVRGEGAGIGDPDVVTDGSPTWEGFFRVRAFISGVNVHSELEVDDDGITFDEATIRSWNAGSLATVTFRISNVKNDYGDNVEYESDFEEITVTLVE